MRPNTDTRVVFKDDKDWLEAGVFMIFLIVFPIAIVMMWREPREVVPLYFAVPFTLVFAVVVPFLVRRVTSARTRHIILDLTDGGLEIVERTPFRRDRKLANARDVTKAEFRTTDDDGYWHTASLVLADGSRFAFAQGNVNADVRGKFDALLGQLRQFNPDIPSRETKE